MPFFKHHTVAIESLHFFLVQYNINFHGPLSQDHMSITGKKVYLTSTGINLHIYKNEEVGWNTYYRMIEGSWAVSLNNGNLS